jgi:hypothetical protein
MNIMKFLFIILIFIASSLNSSAQKEKKDSLLCSEMMNEVSYYWKLDSVPNNGFRYFTYHLFFKCKIDSIDRETLLTRLGNPNSIMETNHGFEYRYYVFDAVKMPKEFVSPLACWYISFNFDLTHKYIKEIETGDIER